MNTLDTVANIFKKRIFITRFLSAQIHQEKLKNRISFLSARHGYQFIDIKDVYKLLDPHDPTHAKDPHIVVTIIKKLVDSNKSFSR